jgi:hypothetical protein
MVIMHLNKYYFGTSTLIPAGEKSLKNLLVSTKSFFTTLSIRE